MEQSHKNIHGIKNQEVKFYIYIQANKILNTPLFLRSWDNFPIYR